MPRPQARGLTERELEIMHVVWDRGPSSVSEVRDALEHRGLDRAHTTVATLVKILVDKGFLQAVEEGRPRLYGPTRTRDAVSGHLLGDLLDRVFRGSREQLLVQLLRQKRLSRRERQRLEEILRETES